MVGNAALWALLCVLVVLVLVLAAVLLAGGRQKGGLAAAAAAAVGGGLALSRGGSAPPQGLPDCARYRAPFYGGRDLDLGAGNIATGAGALGFPADQQAPVDVQAEHHALRTDVRNGLAAYLATRGDVLSAPPALGIPADAPAAGWAATDPDVILVRDNLSLMCDAMRGEFGGQPARPNGPWRNPTWPGPNPLWPGPDTSRWGVWQQAKVALVAALGRLCPQLVTAAPVDMPAKAPLDNAALLAAALHDPNIVVPAAPSPATLTIVTAVTHPKAGGGGGSAIVRLRNWLARALAPYGNTNLAVGPDLRTGQPSAAAGGAAAGPYIDVLDADQRAADAIASFNRLAAFYVAGPVAFADIAGSRAEILTLRTALCAWALVVREGMDPAVPLTAAFTGLVDNSIGGSNIAVAAPNNSARFAAENLAPPPAPVWPARLATSVAGGVGAGAGLVNQPAAPIGNLAVAVNGQLDNLLARYNACSAAYELDWDTVGPLERNVEQAFADLLATYNAAPTVARARQSIADKAAIFVAVAALRAALGHDVAFQAALRAGALANARAVALQTIVVRLAANNREVAALLPGATAVPVPPHPAESANIALLIDPRNYDRTIVDVGYKCRDLLAAVFRRSAGAPPPAWDGIRRQVRDLHRAFRLDPAAPELAQVELDTEQMAVACFSFANTGNVTYIPTADAARLALDHSLAALNAAVQGEALLVNAVDPPNNAARKVAFAACVAQAQAALAAIPVLKPLPMGMARSVGPTNRPPLPDSMRLIHYEQPPTETIGIVRDVSEIPAGTRTDVVIEAQSADALESMVARLPESGPRLVYGLVVDRPGDMVALYKAVAICLKMRPPPAIEKQVASRKNAATGWLYDIVRFESGSYYTRLREYIKPELYAVDV